MTFKITELYIFSIDSSFMKYIYSKDKNYFKKSMFSVVKL